MTIKIVCVGSGAGNVARYLIAENIESAEVIYVNTDDEHLQSSPVHRKILIGNGQSAGSVPAVGAKAAEDSQDELRDMLSGADIMIIVACMGGGTGSGASPIITRIAKSLVIETVAIATMPFDFEGSQRMKQAKSAIEALKVHSDDVHVIEMERLRGDKQDKKATFSDIYLLTNDAIYRQIRTCITDR